MPKSVNSTVQDALLNREISGGNTNLNLVRVSDDTTNYPTFGTAAISGSTSSILGRRLTCTPVTGANRIVYVNATNQSFDGVFKPQWPQTISANTFDAEWGEPMSISNSSLVFRVVCT